MKKLVMIVMCIMLLGCSLDYKLKNVSIAKIEISDAKSLMIKSDASRGAIASGSLYKTTSDNDIPVPVAITGNSYLKDFEVSEIANVNKDFVYVAFKEIDTDPNTVSLSREVTSISRSLNYFVNKTDNSIFTPDSFEFNFLAFNGIIFQEINNKIYFLHTKANTEGEGNSIYLGYFSFEDGIMSNISSIFITKNDITSVDFFYIIEDKGSIKVCTKDSINTIVYSYNKQDKSTTAKSFTEFLVLVSSNLYFCSGDTFYTLDDLIFNEQNKEKISEDADWELRAPIGSDYQPVKAKFYSKITSSIDIKKLQKNLTDAYFYDETTKEIERISFSKIINNDFNSTLTFSLKNFLDSYSKFTFTILDQNSILVTLEDGKGNTKLITITKDSEDVIQKETIIDYLDNMPSYISVIKL